MIIFIYFNFSTLVHLQILIFCLILFLWTEKNNVAKRIAKLEEIIELGPPRAQQVKHAQKELQELLQSIPGEVLAPL